MSSGFIQFLTEQNIINIALATMIGFYLNDFTNNVSQILITPIINIFLNKRDRVENIENFYIEIFNAKFMLGKLLVLCLRLILTLLIIYLLYVIINKITNEKKMTLINDKFKTN